MAAACDIAHEQKQAVDGLVEPAIAERVARQRTPAIWPDWEHRPEPFS